jgi:hypothetical protein
MLGGFIFAVNKKEREKGSFSPLEYGENDGM